MHYSKALSRTTKSACVHVDPDAGVHDALVILNDRMALNDGIYSEQGVAMEFQPFGNTLPRLRCAA